MPGFRSLLAFWMGGYGGLAVGPTPPPVVRPPVGTYLPDWGELLIVAKMEEDKERERGMPTHTERPPMPLPSQDWGQEIIRQLMAEDEEDARQEVPFDQTPPGL